MSSLHTGYHSQSSNTPSSIIQALVMSQPGSQPGSRAGSPHPQPPPPPPRQGPAGRPRFTCQDKSAPSRGELIAYFNLAETYHQTMMGILQFMAINPALWPPPINFSVEPTVRSVATIYRMVAEMERTLSDWETCLNDARVAQARTLSQTLSRAATAQPQGSYSGNKLKVPRPAPFIGKKGDPAFTFIAACNNFRIMDPGAFSSDEVFIQWSLQQMSDQAGQWAVMQMMRLDTETDSQGRPPKELRKWKNFCEHFINQFSDPGLIEKAKNQWKQGLNQMGRAVDYFQKVEEILLRLSYPRDAEMVINQVQMGLKSHIRTHFIGRSWNTLNEMKAEIIPFDSAHWEINNAKPSSEKSWTQTSGSKATTTQSERSKSQTPHIKTETAKTGTSSQ